MGFHSFCYYNPIKVKGAMDDPKIVTKLDIDTEEYVDDFKKEIDEFLNK